MRRYSAAVLLAVTAVAVAADTTAPAPSGYVHVFTLDPTGMHAPADSCESEGCRELLRLINGAEHKIDFAIYGLRGQSAIHDAIAAAKRRGVVIRGIVDKDANDFTYYADTDKLIATVGNVKTDHLHDREKMGQQEPYDMKNDRCPRPEGLLGPLQCIGYDLGETCLVSAMASEEAIEYEGDIMHDKFFVIDDRYVWTGSANISDSDITGYSANVVVSMDSPEMAAAYTAEVNQMYDQGLFHEQKVESGGQRIEMANGTVTVWFLPQKGPVDSLRWAIQHAREKIDISIFYFTHKELADDVIQAHLRGVDVRVIVDATSAKNGYSKHELLRAAGVPVKVENWGGKMHAKAAMIDNRVVFAGSMNWTSAGYRGNDENYLKIESKEAVERYEEWYDKLWTAIPDKWLQGRPDPESRDSLDSCTDRSDNDFDGKKDADDPGCSKTPPPMDPLPPYEIVKKEEGHRLIKGVTNDDGKKVYLAPDNSLYDSTRVDANAGDHWFCSELQAKEAGYYRSSR